MRKFAIFVFILVICLGLLSILSDSSTQAADQAIVWPEISLQPFVEGLDHPVFMTSARDGSGRLFVVEEPGRIQIIRQGQVESTPFLDISDRVHFDWEEGLLSLVFPPDYSSKGYFYVYYTNLAGDNRVSRFYVSPNPDIADPASEELILYLNHPVNHNHNGGLLAFGPDGYLYIGTGDGGAGGDPNENAQNPASYLGKILRIDVEAGEDPYIIPSSNPYTQTNGYLGEIWALGLRNPWRYAFDRLTNDLYIADVGQEKMEEVNFQPASSPGGENYGWDVLEGTLCFEPSVGCIPPDKNVLPVTTYIHGVNDEFGCSITGGYVYRGLIYPRMQGIYFYTDFCIGFINGLQRDGNTWVSQHLMDSNILHGISSFAEDDNGGLYVLSYTAGEIFRIVDSQPIQPVYTLRLPLVMR